VWDVKVSKNDEGWIAEYAIPFKTLRFRDIPTQQWGFNLARKVVRLNEESNWTAIPIRYTGLRVSMAGTLEGIENIHQGRNLKVKPCIAVGITQVRSNEQTQTLQSLSRLICSTFSATGGEPSSAITVFSRKTFVFGIFGGSIWANPLSPKEIHLVQHMH
jgi:hypothetical protein